MFAFLFFQLVVSLLFVVAIAALAVTLGEDFGQNNDQPSTQKNPGVYYANPVLYAVSWVNIPNFVSIHREDRIDALYRSHNGEIALYHLL